MDHKKIESLFFEQIKQKTLQPHDHLLSLNVGVANVKRLEGLPPLFPPGNFFNYLGVDTICF